MLNAIQNEYMSYILSCSHFETTLDEESMMNMT